MTSSTASSRAVIVRSWLSCDLGWATTSTTKRGRDERAIERVGWSELRWRRRRQREAETREWLREWAELSATATSTTERGRDERVIESGLSWVRGDVDDGERQRRESDWEWVELSATATLTTKGGRDERVIKRVRKRQKRMRGFRLGKGIEGFSIRIQKAQNDAVLGKKKKKGRNGTVLS